MLEPMAKIEIIGSRRVLDATMLCLQRHGRVQLIDATTQPGGSLAPLPAAEAGLDESSQLRHLRTRLDALIDLGYVPADSAGTVPVALDAVAEEVDRLAPVVEPVVAAIDALDAERTTLPRHVESLRRLVPLVPQLPDLTAYETVALLIDRKPGL